MSTAPIFGDPLEIDVGLRGIANDGIHCDGGLGANCYASCHETHGVNSHHYEYAANPFESVYPNRESHCPLNWTLLPREQNENVLYAAGLILQ